MVDKVTEQLAEFAHELRFADIPERVRHEMQLRILDTVGCALAGADTVSSRIAKELLPRVVGGPAGRVLGGARDTTPDAAAYANGVMLRDLDLNDWYSGGHPSDCLGAILALAEEAGADGPRVITAAVVAYEVFIRFCACTPVKERGWDQGFAMCVGTAAGLSNLLGLDREQTAHAIALAAVAHLPLRATKSGQMSLWKGANTAHAARNAVHCTLLAQRGMTGPAEVFEGPDGVWQLVTGPFEFPPLLGDEAVYYVPRVSMKSWPVCYHVQAPLAAALQLREQVPIGSLGSIQVETYVNAWKLNGSDPARWDPQSPESADHSIPYAVVVAMTQGQLDRSAFAESAYANPDLRPLMAKVSVAVAPDLEERFPEEVGVRLIATEQSGKVHRVSVTNPPGHVKNPLSERDVEAKFLGCTTPVLGPARAGSAVDFWGHLARADSLTDGFHRLVPAGAEP